MELRGEGEVAERCMGRKVTQARAQKNMEEHDEIPVDGYGTYERETNRMRLTSAT